MNKKKMNYLQKNKRKVGVNMYENDTNSIKRAQEGDKFELERLIKYNNRTHMEYSKKVSRKRI